MKPLFSVIVLCYRHFEYLYEAIDSVLKQDYPAIELVVSDDGSQNFPEQKVKQYIEKHKSGNIQSVQIRCEPENYGTVKHLNHAVQACTGEFIVALAGDDILASEAVLSRYCEGFAAAEEDCYIQMAQTGMYDESLQTLMTYYLKGKVQKAIEETSETTQPLLHQLLINGPCLPSTSTCFKQEFFKRFGSFDESYKLIEDYPMHLRLAKEGWIIHYENFVAIKHRHGGISHGQVGALTTSSLLYYEDLRKMISELIMSNLNLIPEEYRSLVYNHRRRELRWIDFYFAKKKRNVGKVLLIGIKNPFLSLRMALEWLYPKANKLKKTLLLCPLMWLMIDDVASMISSLLNTSVEGVCMALYQIAAILFVVGAASLLVWMLNQIMWRLERFPIESIVVG